jgi:hypothetical protein
MRVSPFHACLTFLALLLTSCDTYHHEQYKISRAANVGDRTKVKEVLASIASSSGLRDCYRISRAPHTVALYCDMDVVPYSGAQLGAREAGSVIVIDLLHSLGSQTRAFNRAHKLLEPALSAKFGERLSVVDPPEELHINTSNQSLQPTAGRSDN